MTRPCAPASACRRVLIVDDEPHLRAMLMEAISEMHFHPSGVGTAESAMRALQKENYDIIVLDLNLPGASGMDFLASLQAQRPRPQVIIHTGFGSLEDARRALRLDVVDFLAKPCGLSELETALERARNRRVAELGQALGPQIIPDQLSTSAEDYLQSASALSADPSSHSGGSTSETSGVSPEAPKSLDDLEREHILAALVRNGGNRAAAAAQLGISVRKLYYRLEDYQRSGHFRP